MLKSIEWMYNKKKKIVRLFECGNASQIIFENLSINKDYNSNTKPSNNKIEYVMTNVLVNCI